MFIASFSLFQDMLNETDSVELSSYSESAMCATVFRILKAVVASWLRDISVHRNVFADFQIIHFYRWLRSSSALLYDPALRRMLQNLMRKYFVQLLAEFQRLGATVVYADFGRIVLATKKRRVVDALSYVGFVCASLRQKELFRSLELNVQHSWQLLVWLDPANYGGFKGKSDTENDTQGCAIVIHIIPREMVGRYKVILFFFFASPRIEGNYRGRGRRRWSRCRNELGPSKVLPARSSLSGLLQHGYCDVYNSRVRPLGRNLW